MVRNTILVHFRIMTEAQMKIRLSADLKAQLEEAVKRSRRSLNGEIVARLEETFRAEAAGMLALVPDIADPKVQLHGNTIAIKELRDEVDELRGEIDALKRNLSKRNV